MYFDTGLGGGIGEPGGQRLHAADGGEHALDGVHVGDDGEEAERFERTEPGVHGLEREETAQTVVCEEPADLGRPRSERTDSHEAGELPGAARHVRQPADITGDETVELEPVQLRRPGHETPVAVGIGRSAETSDLVGHVPHVGPNRERTPVGEPRPIGGIEPHERAEIVQVGSDRGKCGSDEIDHRHHGRAGIEPETLMVDQARTSARQ